MLKPFLYRFKKSCHSTQQTDCKYDLELDALVSDEETAKTLAIFTRSLGTKKENLEKGEDEGPSLFW